MKFEFTSERIFIDLFTKNKEGEFVYPHEKSKRGSDNKGLEITLTGKKMDYHIVGIEQFIEHIANGDFDEIGRVRMKPIIGGQSNGYAVRKATMSKKLIEKIESVKKSKRFS